MNRYNDLMARHFRDCHLLAETTDPCRNRTGKIFYIGERDLLGYSDGTDAFLIHPDSCFKDLKLPERIAAHEGREIPTSSTVFARPRPRIALESTGAETPAPVRRRVINV